MPRKTDKFLLKSKVDYMSPELRGDDSEIESLSDTSVLRVL